MKHEQELEIYIKRFKEQAQTFVSRGLEASMFNDYLKALECKSNAQYYKRLAELLEELQKWRSIREKINALCDTDCDYPEYRSSGCMCDACAIGTVKEFFKQLFDE